MALIKSFKSISKSSIILTRSLGLRNSFRKKVFLIGFSIILWIGGIGEECIIEEFVVDIVFAAELCEESGALR